MSLMPPMVKPRFSTSSSANRTRFLLDPDDAEISSSSRGSCNCHGSRLRKTFLLLAVTYGTVSLRPQVHESILRSLHVRRPTKQALDKRQREGRKASSAVPRQLKSTACVHGREGIAYVCTSASLSHELGRPSSSLPQRRRGSCTGKAGEG